MTCEMCDGRGEVGGFDHAEMGYRTEPCPACRPVLMPCECCGSEGRIYRGQYEDERDCGECPVCDGTGSALIESEPASLEDIACPHCGASINPMLFPCFEQGCPQ